MDMLQAARVLDESTLLLPRSATPLPEIC
jgi:hypothetical protein